MRVRVYLYVCASFVASHVSYTQPDFSSLSLLIPPHLYADPKIAFALDVASAYHDGNYIKFFRLARTAPYIESCVIHRHFRGVRCNALSHMAGAYKYPTSRLSVNDITLALCFTSEEETREFLQSCNVEIDDKVHTIPYCTFITAW